MSLLRSSSFLSYPSIYSPSLHSVAFRSIKYSSLAQRRAASTSGYLVAGLFSAVAENRFFSTEIT